MDAKKIFFGKRLKNLMRERGISYDEMGEKLGLSGRIIYRICLGGTNPSIYTFMDMCEILGVTMDEFFEPMEQELAGEGTLPPVGSFSE